MIEVIKQLFGGSVSAIEAFVGSVGVMGILSLFLSIFYDVYIGKKYKKEKAEIIASNQKEINDFKAKYEVELNALKTNLTKSLDGICNMLLIELKKSGFDMETINAVIDIYKKTITNEILDTDKLIADKEEEIAQEQSTQEEVNENINKIKELNGLV